MDEGGEEREEEEEDGVEMYCVCLVAVWLGSDKIESLAWRY